MNESNNNWNNNIQMNEQNNSKQNNTLTMVIILFVVVLLGIGIGVGATFLLNKNNNIVNDNNINNDNNSNSNSDTNNTNNNNQNDNNQATDTVKGQYTRDAFSGNTFEYNTGYQTATFIFKKDSTFEVNYSDGNKYKGTYEIYNGFFITAKASEIKNDTSISSGEQLSNDIVNVANKMMDSVNGILNTYLIWLKTDDNVIQPFMISYNPDIATGTAVNILGQVQGNFNLK